MGMSGIYGPPKNEEEMIQLIHHAIDSGITFLDTSDVYGPFLNEILLGKVSLKHLCFSEFTGSECLMAVCSMLWLTPSHEIYFYTKKWILCFS